MKIVEFRMKMIINFKNKCNLQIEWKENMIFYKVPATPSNIFKICLPDDFYIRAFLAAIQTF